MCNREQCFFKYIAVCVLFIASVRSEDIEVDCSTLRMGQYICPDPSYDYVDPKTQTLRGCRPDNKAKGMTTFL